METQLKRVTQTKPLLGVKHISADLLVLGPVLFDGLAVHAAAHGGVQVAAVGLATRRVVLADQGAVEVEDFRGVGVREPHARAARA